VGGDPSAGPAALSRGAGGCRGPGQWERGACCRPAAESVVVLWPPPDLGADPHLLQIAGGFSRGKIIYTSEALPHWFFVFLVVKSCSVPLLEERTSCLRWSRGDGERWDNGLAKCAGAQVKALARPIS